MVRESPLGEFFDIKKIIYARSIRIDKQSTYLTKKNIDNFFIDSVGRKFPAKKSNDIYRIICIGSSTTEGHGAGMESYPVRLEELLKDSIENVEVINAGIKGAQFYSLYIYLKDILLKLEPDLIIVYFGYNDDSFAVYQYFQRAQEIKIKYPFIDNVEDLEYALNFRFCSPSLLKIYRWLFSSRLFTVLKLNLNNMITNFGFKDVDEQQNKGFKKKNIGMLIDCCLSHSASLVLIPEVIMHDSGEYAGYFKDFEDEARAIYYYCPNRVDLIGYLTDSVHFTKEGYKHLAYQIGYYILEKNIVFRSKTTSGNGE